MADRVFCQVQAAEMECFRGVHDMTLRDKVFSCEIRKALSVKRLFFRIES